MAQNYAKAYSSFNDSPSLDQRFYLKVETTRGTFVGPGNSDYFVSLPGSSISYNQPFDPSTVRSGRHNTSTIRKKKEMSFTLKSYFNIDLTQPSAVVTEIDQPVRTLLTSTFGNEVVSGGTLTYNTASDPQITFSLYEIGDRWARQARGCFVQDASFSFPGDGEATVEYTGSGKDAFLTGIGQTQTTVAGGNTFTLQTGDGSQFQVNSLVMIILADGVTRSADTPANSYRTVTAVSGDAVTISGAALTSASDGAPSTPSYLVFFEPSAPVGIDQPVTGLVGSCQVVGIPTTQGIRQVMIKFSNNHELANYYYGQDSLGFPLFTPANRAQVTASIEVNLDRNVIGLFNRIQDFSAQAINFVLGDSTARHMAITLPKIQFPVPSWTVPDTGSIPITFEGTGYQTALDAADEISLSFL